MKTITKRDSLVSYCLLGQVLILASLCMSSCTKEDESIDNPPSIPIEASTVVFHGAMSGNGASSGTRTSVDGEFPGNALSLWEAGDYIFVVDGPNVVKSDLITQSATTADFTVGSENITSDVTSVYYAGNDASTYNQVSIDASQVQAAPDNSQHLGSSGDCGYAEAVKNSNGEYDFTLNHKSAVICFKPWVDADLSDIGLDGSSIKIKSISVTSETNIAGDYTLSSTGLEALANQSNSITLTCGEGFTLANTKEESQAAAGSYMVVAPSTSDITIKYGVEYYKVVPTSGSAVTLQNTVVRKISNKEFLAGKIYTINCHITAADLEKVDLGYGTQSGYENIALGSWAIRNVGETTNGTTETSVITPVMPGGYYDWGATISLTENDMSNTLWSESTAFGWLRSGITEGTCLTDLGHDVARNLWGGSWRMPTLGEISNLCNGATWEIVGTIAPSSTIGYTAGYKVTGSNENSIYLPAAGYIYKSDYEFVGRLGWYWSSTASTEYYSHHLSMWLNANGCAIGNGWRDVAQSVRPIHE